jgi:hypothetical protein
MNPSPSLVEAVDRFIESKLYGLNVALPAEVISYNATTQTATVQPLVQAGYYNDTNTRQVERRPTISDVPILFPGTGAFSVTWPINVGDTVLLVFSSSSLDKWLALGGEVDPGDDRRHDISDAVAIPGLRARPQALPSSAVDSTAMVLSAPAIYAGGQQPLALKSDVDALASAFNTHVHSGGTLSGGLTGVPGAAAPSTTGTIKLKGG